jgi:hypothetical protein
MKGLSTETFFCVWGYDYNDVGLIKLSFTEIGGFDGLSDNIPELVGFLF